MIFVSIDIETTGLDTERYDILSIGAIIEDTNKKLPFKKIPKFHAAIKHREITGSPFAINMNGDLISAISSFREGSLERREEIRASTGMEFLDEDEVVEKFFQFLYINNIPKSDIGGTHLKIIDGNTIPLLTSKMKPTVINVAGKNFQIFDKIFLERLPRWKQAIKIRGRIIDPAILFVDWKKDESLPGLGEYKKRAGIDGIVTHNALEDAWDVIELLRKTY